jgi:hypothetical protein
MSTPVCNILSLSRNLNTPSRRGRITIAAAIAVVTIGAAAWFHGSEPPSKGGHANPSVASVTSKATATPSASVTSVPTVTSTPTPTGIPTVTPPPPPTASTDTAARRYGWGSVASGDEFNYSGAPDPTKWDVYDSDGHDGKGLRSATAWRVDGSVVQVTGDTTGITGGMAAEFAHQKYGRWETRMRTNARDPKYHPVLILWPDGDRSTCPEIDYGEGSSDTTKVRFYLHFDCGGEQVTADQAVDTTKWHNYAVEWTSTGITGYIDGVPFFKDWETGHLPPGSMHQTLQLDWFPDGTPTKTSWMQVDWVRVYNVG